MYSSSSANDTEVWRQYVCFAKYTAIANIQGLIRSTRGIGHRFQNTHGISRRLSQIYTPLTVSYNNKYEKNSTIHALYLNISVKP